MRSNIFWHIYAPKSLAKRAEWAHKEIHTEKIVCPVNQGHRRGGKRISNLSVVLPGRKVEDFVWTWYSECLVQDSVLELFRAHELEGFETKPVKGRFNRHRTEEPPRLHELIVTGWAGMASPESGIRLDESCDACGDLHYSGCTNPAKLINASQWDGSDFFMVWPLPKYIFITDRVVQVIRDNQLTGATFVSLDSLQCGSTGFSPGRLSYWMPEARARELGGPLGVD